MRITVSILTILLLLLNSGCARSSDEPPSVTKIEKTHQEPRVCLGATLNLRSAENSRAVKQALEAKLLRDVDATADVSRIFPVPGKEQVVSFSSREDLAQFWSLPSLELQKSLNLGVDPVASDTSVSFGDGRMTVCNYKFGEVWDLDTETLVQERVQAGLPHETREAVSGYRAATVAETTTTVWNKSGKVIAEFPDPDKMVRHLRLNSDGTLLAISRDLGREKGRDKGSDVEIYDTRSKERLLRISFGKGLFTKLRFSADGSFFVAGSSSGRVVVWDLQEGKLRFSGQSGRGMRGLEISPSGKLLVVAGRSSGDTGLLALWDVQSGKPIFHFETKRWVANAFFWNEKAIVFGTWGGKVGIFEHEEFLSERP